jgi:hypothetical protein
LYSGKQTLVILNGCKENLLRNAEGEEGSVC